MTSAPDPIAEIDQLLAAVASSGKPFQGSVHLHCTDDDRGEGTGEWLIAGTADGVVLQREHAKGDAALRGPAAALLAVLRSEAELSTVDTVGDEAAARRLVDALR